MTLPISREKTPLISLFIIIMLPFLIFYWMVPFIANQSIGNDYQLTSIENQMELLFSIRTGSFPLFVPGFASDHSASALTLGEVFHPLPHIASILPGYWNGKALQWNTFLRLLSLGLTHLALFVFLRRLTLNVLFSFLFSCITVYNLRMLDMFRYGASLESYTGHLLLCSAIGLYFINRTKCVGPLSIIGATYLLITSGHPQMMYYGLLGAGFFLLVVPFFISAMMPEKETDFKAALMFWIQAGFYLVLGIFLASAYILPFYFDFIATNAERVGQTYTWADSIKDTLAGTLSNFFIPLRSEVHGAFGGSSLFIMAALMPLLRFFKVKIPRPIWFIWGMIIFVLLYMQGSRTPVHRWVWEYLPFVSSFRYAGRISLIMPVLLMMMLSWTFKVGAFPIRLRSKIVDLTPSSLLAAVSLTVIGIYLSLMAASYLFRWPVMTEFAPFTPLAIRKIPRFIEILVILSGMTALAAMALYDSRTRRAKATGVLLCLATVIQVGTVLKYGTWVTERRDQPTFEEMMTQKEEKLDYRFYPGTGMYSSVVTKQLENSFMEPFLGKIFTEIVPVSNQDDAYFRMKQNRTPQQVFIEGYEPDENFSLHAQNIHLEDIKVELVYSSFNRLQFRVFTPISSFLGLSYPYTEQWRAWLNDHEVPVYRANGAAHAIQIPKGKSLIEFRYWSSSAFWGMLISFATFIIIGFYFSGQAAAGLSRAFSVVLVLTLAVGGLFLWCHSLYTGDNLGTKYSWTYTPPLPKPNLAFGKITWMSSSYRGSPGYLHNSRAVDGDISPKSGFLTHLEENPAWSVDLHRVEKVSSIILHESFNDPQVNIRPLNIFVSVSGEQWHLIDSINSIPDRHGILSVDFNTPENARFIKLQAQGLCRLSFDEVEVYGPGK